MRATLEPAAARRLLRYELERMTRQSGRTHAEMGARLGVSRAAFSQLLSGKTMPSRAAVEVIALHCGVEHRIDELVAILAVAKARNPPPVPSLVHDDALAIGLEAVATKIEVYEPGKIAPLLQTEDYARAVLSAHAQARPELDVSAQVEQLLQRQTVLDHIEFTWVTEQTALLRPVAEPAVIADQLRHLHALTERPNITIQIALATTAPMAAFQLTRLADGQFVAHQQTARSAYCYDAPDEYAALVKHLRSQAFDPERSRALLAHSILGL